MATRRPGRALQQTGPKPEYHAYGAASALFHSEATELVLSGPAGTGKSRACLEYLHWLAWTYPGMRGLIVRQTRESLTQAALVTYEEKVLSPRERRRIAGNCQRRVRQSYLYPNGSELVLAGMDKPGKIMSTEFDVAYVQEAIDLTENGWESVTSRLRNGVTPLQRIFGDTNPDGPRHWLKQRADRGDTVFLESRHEDNPALWDRARGCWTPLGLAYIAKLDKLTGARKPRLRFGRWTQAEGMVYEGWDRSIHLINRFAIPRNWRRIRVIDFGFTNPFVCQWWAIDGDGDMYLYREIFMSGRTVVVHARQIKDLSSDEQYEATIADHDREDRETLRENGIRTKAAHKAVLPGIEAVQERLVPRENGRPRLFVLRDSLVEVDEELRDAKKPCCTAEEFDGYVWAKSPDGQPVKEEPLKVNDHGMDTTRYAVAYVDGLGRKKIEAA